MDIETKEKLKSAQKLKKEKKYQESKEIYDEYYEKNPNSLSNWDKKTYAWDIYYLHMQNPESKEELFENLELLCDITTQEDKSKNDKYPCPYTLSILKGLDYLNREGQFNDMLFLTDKINPEYLSEKPSKFHGQTYASNKEKYYNHLTKALLKTDYVNEALEASKEALNINPLLDDTWFKWRIAKSYKELGEYDKSLECLENLSKQKNDWFIYAEIGDNYYYKNNNEKALEYSIKAVLAPGQVESKVNLYSLLGELLKDTYPEESMKHYYLEYSVRLANEWNIDDELTEKIEDNDFDINNKDYMKIERELKKFWNDLKFKNQDPQYGIISKILPNGKAGFIQCEDGNSYYFRKFEFKGLKEEFDEMVSVKFYLEQGYDKSKDEYKLNAVNVHPM
ncbi:MAG: hypothetical protein E7Z80_05295 [Methanobrevibacter thaueri]|nr:hypothetical protein [Methanobrevibacter thaueri]